MKRNLVRPVAVLASTFAFATALTGATTATAATPPSDIFGVQDCYGSAKTFFKPAGRSFFPVSPPNLRTTTNCGDINLKPNSSVFVRVCFEATGACNSFKYAPAGQWTVIASGVRDNSGYAFSFQNPNIASSGIYAG